MAAEQVLAFFLFAIAAAITPGPSNLILTSTGANVGVLRGLPCLCGVAIGMGIMMFLAAFGIGSFLLERPVILKIFKCFGISFLLWLSWKIATAARSDTTSDKEFLGFWGAAAFQWVNPKSWLVCVSAASTYLSPEANSAFVQSIYFGVLFVLAALPSCFNWLAFGALLQKFLVTERAARMFNLAMGAMLAGSIILII
jgi:threonine/homoserine/homoserine lactone efflux protein